jgi:Co/Zn/Cd efflux system component
MGAWAPEKARIYQRARNIGLMIFAFQVSVLFFFIGSRVLGADTVHSFLDVAVLAGTALLLGRFHASREIFTRRYRRLLLFGVLTLALGGIAIGLESLWQILFVSHSGKPDLPLALLVVAAVGGLGNLRMHKVLSAVHHHERDALDKNNIDHVFWDMVLSFAVFCSGLSMWIWQTNAFDHYIAIVVGFFVLPYLSIRRWRENSGEGHHHDKHDGHDHTAPH